MKKATQWSESSVGTVGSPAEALGESEAFLTFQEQLSRVAKVDRPVLIVGERGTGKELVASRLHYLSMRWQGPLITLNCAALAPTLLEAELFGHETGAFTGASRLRRGRFEAAHQGTLFLDEIGLIPREVQEKILRVVEYATFERVGSSEPIHLDVRIIGATNADLPDLAERGQFKVDLLDRLSFEVLHLPPLRERRGDVMLLATHFAARMSSELGRAEPPEFSEEAVRALEGYPWPGNIRELKNVVERAVYRGGENLIQRIDFDPFGSRAIGSEKSTAGQLPMPAPAGGESKGLAFPLGKLSLHEAVRELEISALRQALQKSCYHQAKAARLLGLTYHQLRALYRKHRAALGETG